MLSLYRITFRTIFLARTIAATCIFIMFSFRIESLGIETIFPRKRVLWAESLMFYTCIFCTLLSDMAPLNRKIIKKRFRVMGFSQNHIHNANCNDDDDDVVGRHESLNCVGIHFMRRLCFTLNFSLSNTCRKSHSINKSAPFAWINKRKKKTIRTEVVSNLFVSLHF